MLATYEEGTDLVLDDHALTLGGVWADTNAGGAGSDVFRLGSMVVCALRVTNKAAAAWSKKKYKEGELAAEGGKVYKAEGAGLVAKETDENKPSTKPTMWVVVGQTNLVTTLPGDFRPVHDCLSSDGKLEAKANGEVLTTLTAEELEAAVARVFQIVYRAAS